MWSILSESVSGSGRHLHLILLMGTAIFFGTIAAGLVQRLRIPQIIGFIAIGVILGPILGVKFGAARAGELGLNVTEEDLIKTYTVGEVMDTEVSVITAGYSGGSMFAE